MKTNLDRIVEHKSLLIFAGGAVAAIVGKQILESEATKKFCINTAVKVMQMRDEAEEILQNVKENAEDIHHDAKLKTKKEIYVEEIDDKAQKTVEEIDDKAQKTVEEIDDKAQKT